MLYSKPIKTHHIKTEDAMHILPANINLIFKSASDFKEKYFATQLYRQILK